jgi:3-oxoadipate enol-lactonase
MAQTEGMRSLVESTLSRWFAAEGYRASHPEVMARIGEGILETPVHGFCGCREAISKIDLLVRLHEIKCPSLIMVGEHDHGTPPEMSRLMQSERCGLWSSSSFPTRRALPALSERRFSMPKFLNS